MDLLLLAAGLVLGVIVGWLAARVAAHGRPSALEDPAVVAERHRSAVLEARHEGERAVAALRAELAAAEAHASGLARQVADGARQYRELQDRHAAETEARRRRDVAENRVMETLAPIREALGAVAGKVTELEQQRAAQYGAIEQQLAQTREANEQVRRTAEGLASSLRSNSVRGAWGEAQLRRLVEAAGLTNRVDFDLQATSADGSRRPDMVVRLPEGKCIAVDAKVPLARFIEANEIPATAGGAEGARRDALLQEHVKALRAHIDALGGKGYWSEMTSPEFVVAFLPSESLLSAALAADPTLLDYSFGKRVALASPVNLWAVLKTVAYTWTQQKLTDEAHALFTLSTTLYDRLSGLAVKAEALRRSLEGTVKAYNGFAATLETRVLVTARQINRVDESKIIGTASAIEEPARAFTQPELVAAD